ncbi:hypothetical protein [Palpita vitrealis nucleopolyhedrovirus]|uniref:Uncharacterized protein n=1 Tax=Palpita vitrealis nucleopolyhedrovirus TaxID=2951960 RepID=A0AAE9LNL2_9ABAC|nr:hypothetical protein [Palpita vitrealis nucleopolyhedrovirus]
MYRTSKLNNATLVTSTSQRDYDTVQMKHELNSLRRNLHDLCARSNTSFDCNKFLRTDDVTTSTIATIASKNTINPSDTVLIQQTQPIRETVNNDTRCPI